MSVFLEWHHMTGPAIDALDRATTIVYVSSSPLEVHGPHLPTITDICEAEGIVERTAALLKEKHPELTFVRLPPIYVAGDVLPHVGSLNFRGSTITAVFEDLGRTLCTQGFTNIWVGGFHGGPRHFTPLEVACARTNRRYGAKMISMFSLLMTWLTGGGVELPEVFAEVQGIEPEDLRGDSHGGAIETSLMLHLLGEHVDPVFAELPQRTVSLWTQEKGLPDPDFGSRRPSLRELMASFRTKLKYYEEVSWSGQPALASARLGEQFIDVLARHCAEALSEVWSGHRTVEECHAPTWKVRWLFTWRWLSWLFERSADYRNRVW